MNQRSLFLKLLSAVIVFGAWQIAGLIPVSYAFPTFTESMHALYTITMDGRLFTAYAETLRPLVLGVAISAVSGIGLGLWIGLSSRFDWLFSPIFIVMQAAPLAALIPILVMAYGIGLTSKVFVVCIMAMPVIVLNTSTAVRNTPASIKEMGRSFLASDRDIILKIIIPAASPVIFSGLRLGVSAGFIGAILAELKITPTGVGDIITYSRSIADYPTMYAAIFSIIVLAVLFLNGLERLENTLFEGNNRGYVSD
ncbi:ABC transporter permease [Nitratireductor sp. XY-223]|uniref:ABC transporter permease n=1 Tax=Nitratireductor sp. XY-223 TaxID=2561926 RepID=UPI0010A9E01F|nr:ABC transporter permease [Nitratireductor sp. XY-223]